MKTKETVALSSIKIPKFFTKISQEKYQKKLEQFESGQSISLVKLSKDNVLMDGYYTYLIYKNKGFENIEVIYNSPKVKNETYRTLPTLYIFGHHPNQETEYVWRATSDIVDLKDLEIGDCIFVHTKYGINPIIVTRMEVLNCSPVSMAVKKVCKNTPILKSINEKEKM